MTKKNTSAEVETQEINAIIVKHFGDDAPGAVRAHAAIAEVLSKLRGAENSAAAPISAALGVDKALIERLTEIAHRDSAVSVSVRADDLRAVLATLRHQEPPAAYQTFDDEGSPSMLFFDVVEARTYCALGEEPEPLYRRRAPALGATAEAVGWLDTSTSSGTIRWRQGLTADSFPEGHPFYAAPVASDPIAQVAQRRDEQLREAASAFLKAYRARYRGVYGQIKKHAPLQDEVLALVFAAREAPPSEDAPLQASEADEP